VIFFAVTLSIITYIDRVCISVVTPFIQHDLAISDKQMGLVPGRVRAGILAVRNAGRVHGRSHGPAPRAAAHRGVVVVFHRRHRLRVESLRMMTTQFMFGAGEAGCFPNLTRAFHTWLPKKERVRAQGIMWLSARWGGAFTPPLVIWMVSYVGWRHAFPIFGAVGIVWAVAFYAWFRDDPSAESENEPGGAGTAAPAGWRIGRARQDLVEPAVESRAVWMLCWQYFFLSYGWYFYITWLPKYLRQGRHMNLMQSAWLGVLPLFLAASETWPAYIWERG
jgi:MFS transporter, ACS family, glucarate transporter